MKVGLYKLAEGSYQVSYKNSENKRVRKQFKSHRSAKIYADKVNNFQLKANPELIVKSSKTVGVLLSEYIENNPTSMIKKQSKAAYDSFMACFTGLNPEDLNKTLCGHWIDSLKKEKLYSSRTLRTIKYTFTPFFQDLVDKNIIEKNYLAEVYIKMGTRVKQRVFLSESELIKILDGLKRFSPKATYPVVYFLMHTGCKIGEALKLQWEQIDLNVGTVYFYRTSSSNARILNLSVHILEFLKNHQNIADHVFVNDQGDVWTTTGFYKCMAEDRAALGLNRHWDSFSLRHTFALHFLKSGKTLQQLQVVLGHRRIAQTIQFYNDLNT